MTHKKKLIEVALPLDAINAASARESYIFRGNPSALHKWWAQRPMAAARAVIFAQMVDDPSAHPDLFPTEKKQEKERQRLFSIIRDLVRWESTSDKEVLERAQAAIWQSWRYTCAENADHPRAKELFDRYTLPTFHDPFAGGGTLPLEATRLGLEAHASDLNPVAVLINKAMIEIPPRFAGRPPVNPEARENVALFEQNWDRTEGLAADVRYYGKWIRDEAEKRIGHLYPKIDITPEMAAERADLKSLVGQRLTVIAWLWARTVKSPNPAFAHVQVPLASTFMLSTKAGKEVYVEPVIEGTEYHFAVRVGKPTDPQRTATGTKLSRGGNFRCLLSGAPISPDYIRAEANAGRMGAGLLALVVDTDRGRVYLSDARSEQDKGAFLGPPSWVPDGELPEDARAFTVCLYGMKRWSHLFSDRQLHALATFSDLVSAARALVESDALAAGFEDDAEHFAQAGRGAVAYAEAIGILLAFAQDKTAEYGCTIVPWYAKEDRPKGLFTRQAIPMLWDYAEVNPLGDMGGTLLASARLVAGALAGCPTAGPAGKAVQADALQEGLARDKVVSTDPPYYDNIGYADLSDFFYVWLRRSLKAILPDLFSTLAVPKTEELVAAPQRHGSREKAESFFLAGMTLAMRRLAEQVHPSFPVTIYYAFKQAETDDSEGTASTGWETFLDAVIRAGFRLTGTWPIRTERDVRSRGIGSNALASSIVLVCRPRGLDAPTATRREFVTALTSELPDAVAHLQRGNIAPVDLAQAAIGPGMAVFTRYSQVLNAEGRPLSVRDALALINQTLDEALAEQEGDIDADSRWALAWFEQSGFSEGEFGVADVLARAKNTAVQGLVEAGIVAAGRGKVRLLKPSELPDDWDPATDKRLTAWEIVHHLIRVLEAGGEGDAATLAAKLGSKAETARELCYRLYTLCERKKRAPEALAYNALVQSWPEIMRLARQSVKVETGEPTLFGENEE